MSKTITFSAEYVELRPNNNLHYIEVEVKTDCYNEILEDLTPDEIVDNYDDLDGLYDLLKDKFETT